MGKPPASDAPGSPASDILPLVYDQLRELASHRMREETNSHTLQATALVHEVYMRLAGPMRFANKAHFFKAAAEAMRRVLIDHARARSSLKRGGAGHVKIPLSNILDLAACPEPERILAFEEAISRLEAEAPVAASVVRLRFYAGLTIDETAEALNLSPRSVDREWTFARAWLYRALEE